MAAVSSSAFSTSAFSESAFDFGTVAVVATDTGGGFHLDFANFEMNRGRRKRREEIEEEVEAIPDQVAREIATLIKVNEAKDEERADLARLQALADRYASKGVDVPRPMLASVLKAHEERTRNALEQMQREAAHMLEEEEAAVISMLMLDD